MGHNSMSRCSFGETRSDWDALDTATFIVVVGGRGDTR